MLRQWQIVEFISERSLVGQIYGDRKGRFPDGRWVITSAVSTPRHRIANGQIVKTRNSRYFLSGMTH